LPALKACGDNVLVQDLLEQVMHLHFRRNDLTEAMQEACARRVEVLMTTVASAAIVIRIRAVNVYKFSLNFSKFS
jgi:hypothetical protein